MSINYTCYLDTELSPQALFNQLSTALGTSIQTVEMPQALLGEGLDALELAAGPVQSPVDRFIQEDYQLRPSLSLSLRLDKFQLDQAQNQLVNVLCALLKTCNDDLILLREHDSLAYQRIGGKPELFNEDPLWQSSDRLKQVTSA